MAQTVNIQNFVSGFEIKPDEFMLPLHEVIINAIQSIEDRQGFEDGFITVTVKRGNQISIDGFGNPYKPIIGFDVEDNGIGFIQKRYGAFNEAFSDLNKHKGCKGVGRYTVLACFGSMDVDSSFEEKGSFFSRTFKFDIKNGVHPENEENLHIAAKKEHKTFISLKNYKPAYQDYINSHKVELTDIAETIIEHCLLYFLNDQVPLIRLQNENEPESAIIVNDLYRNVVKFDKQPKEVKLKGIKGNFTLNYLRNYNIKSHSVHLCANNREVGKRISISNYIPSFVTGLMDADAKRYFISAYITSSFLDEKANNQRNKFNIPSKESDKTAFDEISFESLLSQLSEKIRDDYSDFIISAEIERDQKVKNYILNPQRPRLAYKHLITVDDAFANIPVNATEERIESELHKASFILEQKRNKAFEKAFAKKQYDKEEFGEIIKNVLSEEAAFSVGKLADLMVRRKAVIKLFKKYLEWRNDENYMLEEDLHNLIFTMGAESSHMPNDYHNLWLLDERLTFHS